MSKNKSHFDNSERSVFINPKIVIDLVDTVSEERVERRPSKAYPKWQRAPPKNERRYLPTHNRFESEYIKKQAEWIDKMENKRNLNKKRFEYGKVTLVKMLNKELTLPTKGKRKKSKDASIPKVDDATKSTSKSIYDQLL